MASLLTSVSRLCLDKKHHALYLYMVLHNLRCGQVRDYYYQNGSVPAKCVQRKHILSGTREVMLVLMGVM